MGNNSAGNVGSGNQGQTDMDRGSESKFAASKSIRKTGKVGGPSSVPNSNTEDGNKRMVNDPRLS